MKKIKQCDRAFARVFGGSSKMACKLRTIMNVGKVEHKKGGCVKDILNHKMVKNLTERVTKKGNVMIEFSIKDRFFSYEKGRVFSETKPANFYESFLLN